SAIAAALSMVRFSLGIVRMAITYLLKKCPTNFSLSWPPNVNDCKVNDKLKFVGHRLCHTPAGEARAPHHFEQKFKYLDMAPGFIYALSPGVKPVPAQQEPVRVRAMAEKFFQLAREFVHILRIVQDRQPLPMLMRTHAGQTFEHFVARNFDPTVIDRQSGERSAPDRMCVQHRHRRPMANDGQV